MTDYLKFWNVVSGERVFVRPAPGAALFVEPALAPHLTRLALFATQEQSLTLITGEAGTGKSAVLRWLGETTPAATHEFLLIALGQRETTSGWLAPRLADFLSGAALSGARSEGTDLKRAVAMLDDLVEEKRRIIIAVDGAHHAATPAALEELTMLLSLEAHAGGCVSIVLAGDSSLASTVAATPELAPRVVFHLELTRWGKAATAAYIDHRCRLAGIRSPFDTEALAVLHARTRGVAAGVNAFAEHCLVEAALRGVRAIDGALATAVAAQMSLPDAGSYHPPQAAATLPFVTATAAEGRATTTTTTTLSTASDAKPARQDHKAPIRLSSLFKTEDDPAPAAAAGGTSGGTGPDTQVDAAKDARKR